MTADDNGLRSLPLLSPTTINVGDNPGKSIRSSIVNLSDGLTLSRRDNGGDVAEANTREESVQQLGASGRRVIYKRRNSSTHKEGEERKAPHTRQTKKQGREGSLPKRATPYHSLF